MSTCLSVCALNLIELSSFCNFRKGAKFESRKENKSGRFSEEIAILRPTGGPSCLRFNQRKKPPQSRRLFQTLFERVYPFRHQ